VEEGADALDLHHLYRAMAWLGEKLADQSGAGRAPRRTKDVIEERLFARRRSLFTDLSVVLFDTSLYFSAPAGRRAAVTASPRITGPTCAR
jgi:hypothetical protein